ncbi:MAG: sulfatase-like hydrolase/transferase, partial [Actinomycetota bacterium]|nr:sulfatase-like hydrolase/transferase [Actinomycetota bacterium]
MDRTLTRRDFLKVAGAGAAGVTLLGTAGCSRFAQLPEEYLPRGGSKMNVVVVLVDSLRKDHVRAYGNDRIETPNLDALANESLLFTRAYPEAIPSIPARRGIHTGIRSFPFRDWEKWYEDDVSLRGWQPIPRDQTTLAEILADEGYQNLFVTDTLHQFRPFYDMHRGFHVFHFIRGQERDLFRPRTQATSQRIDDVLIGGPSASHARDIMLQYFANTAGREREEDWFTPQVFMKGMEFLEAARGDQPFFLVVDNYDPHEPWDPPEKYTSLYDEGYQNLFVTDTLHQFRPFYDMHRGFHVLHFIRGQERDFFRPRTPTSSQRIDEVLIGGPSATHARDIMLQYFANTAGREREEDWFTPQVFIKG